MIAAGTSTRTPMSTGLVRSVMPGACTPRRSQPAPSRPGGHDDGVGREYSRAVVAARTPVARMSARRALLGEDAGHHGAGAHVDARLQLLAHAREDVVGALGAHVAHRRGDQRHAVQQRLAADASRPSCRRRAPCGWRRTRSQMPSTYSTSSPALLRDELVEPAARPAGVSVSLPSLKAPAPPQPQVMSQGSQSLQTPVVRAGQARLCDVRAASPPPAQTRPSRRTSSSAAKMPAGPAPTMTTS